MSKYSTDEKIDNIVSFFNDMVVRISNITNEDKKERMKHDLISYIYHEGYYNGYKDAKDIYCELEYIEDDPIQTLNFK